jgi:hypothetical protein
MNFVTENESRIYDSAIAVLDETRRRSPSPLVVSDILAGLKRAEDFLGITLSSDERDRTRRNLEERYILSQGTGERGGELNKSPIPDWVPKSKPAAQWPFWYRYRRWLTPRVDPVALQQLDEYTDSILTKLGNPKFMTGSGHPDTWDVRGMVAGHVQSGKTSNYIGLVGKAADAGYKLIIVLTGIHENLRVQTQQRIDDGFIGKKANGDPTRIHLPTGVGDITVPGLEHQPLAFWGTTQNNGGDFRAANLAGFGVEIREDLPPVVLVVKKHASVLRRLLMWVVRESEADLPNQAQGTHFEDKLHDIPHRYRTKCPLLIVDDEADQASVDTAAGAIDEGGGANPDHDPTTINRLIRSLLRSFDRSAYVGYTATPFANILIHDSGNTKTHGDDLFPRDFIINLPTSASYVGPATIFGRRTDNDGDSASEPGLPVLLETVTDHVSESRGEEDDDDWMAFAREGWMPPIHSSDFEVGAIPESLRDALADWTLAGAGLVCRSRGHDHHSMLIHVTRFQNVINRLHERVREYWDAWSVRIANGDPIALRSLRLRWEGSFQASNQAVRAARPQDESVLNPISWSDLVAVDITGKTPLQRAVDGVQVLQIHGGETSQPLIYAKGHQLKVIAIGGNKLSRGLTLENLTVSYFLRTTRMYDTLMQMGRWFGYRPGFLDLCRLYMAPDLRSWFEYLADATEELRSEFERMAAQGLSPREFGLRVLSHPVMTVTSAVKMRHGERIRVGFSNTLTQSVVYDTLPKTVADNWNNLQDFVRMLGSTFERNPLLQRPDKSIEYRGFCWSGVPAARIVEFLDRLVTPPEATDANTQRIAEYIRRAAEKGEVKRWTVFLRSNLDASAREDSFSHEIKVGRSKRRRSIGRQAAPRGELVGRTLATKVLIDSDYETVDIDIERYEEALELRHSATTDEDKSPGRYVREVRDPGNGLLLLYTVQPYDPGEKAIPRVKAEIKESTIVLSPDNPLVGFAVSLPNSEHDIKVEYTVNTVYRSNELVRRMRAQEDSDA